MIARFILLLIAFFIAQVVALHAASRATIAGHPLITIYSPFMDLIEPLVTKWYGTKERGLVALALLGISSGAFVYSAILALLGTLLLDWRPKGKEAGETNKMS